jgi:hypothetical protein
MDVGVACTKKIHAAAHHFCAPHKKRGRLSRETRLIEATAGEAKS